MNVSRRKLLTTAAIGAGALALAACSSDQIANDEAEWAAIAGQIQNAVASAAAYIPTIESIAETAASLFGPAYVTLVQVGSAAFNQVVTVLENVVANLSAPVKATVRRKLMASSPSLPVAVGLTPANVTVYGWKAS